jgi:hypothetical protein
MKNTSTFVDVIIVNKKHYMKPATVVELGLSDHQAQVLPVLSKTHDGINKRIWKSILEKIILRNLIFNK